MLSFVVTDTDGSRRLLSRPLSLTIRMDEEIPADDLSAVFAYTDVGELTSLSVYDEDKLIFTGVVDEQEHVFSESGGSLRVYARSLAAHLLDNEAEPCCYDHPSASLIYERYVKPYGIRWENEDDATYFGEQQIAKGTSCWAVLKSFCKACYSSTPRITADGVLRMKNVCDPKEVCFSDSGDGISYTALTESLKRCEEISAVNVKLTEDSGYGYRVTNDDAVRRGIRRERYLNAALTATPLTCVDTMLENGERAAYGIRLKCPGLLTGIMSCRATVKNKLLGETDGLFVSSLTCRLTPDGETTTLQLKRRKN